MQLPLVIFYLFAVALTYVAAQIEHGSLAGPSGLFQRTRNQAVPPVDLSKPPIYLPEATPITEEPQETSRIYRVKNFADEDFDDDAYNRLYLDD